MATSMTFNSLLEDLRQYLERGEDTDPTVFDQLPRLINLAERDIAQRVKLLGFVTPMISELVAGTPVYAKPDRWRRTVSMNYGVATTVDPAQNSRVPIFARSLEYCQRYWPNQALTAAPKFVADYDYQHWLVAPTPDKNYPWALNLWMLPPLLDDTVQTNWTTDYAPSALLYRALLNATPFLKNDERIPVWERFYEEQISVLQDQDIQRILDRAAVRKED
jgi:hypothetical protein